MLGNYGDKTGVKRRYAGKANTLEPKDRESEWSGGDPASYRERKGTVLHIASTLRSVSMSGIYNNCSCIEHWGPMTLSFSSNTP